MKTYKVSSTGYTPIYRVLVDFKAYYSGRTYEEEYFTTDPKVLELQGTEVYLGELDGKHSDSSTEIQICEVDEEYFETNPGLENDGDYLFEKLNDCEIDLFDPVFSLVESTIICTKTQLAKIKEYLAGGQL